MIYYNEHWDLVQTVKNEKRIVMIEKIQLTDQKGK